MKKLPTIKGSIACLTCGAGSHDTLDIGALLAVGFGDVTVKKDNEIVYSENTYTGNRFWYGKDAEKRAAKDPEHDWRIHFYAPLYEAEYQRQGEKHWVLVKKGLGFA